MKIFVVRHGQTIWNSLGRTQGRTNNRLSDVGKKQAQNTACQLKNIKIDYIFCSPLCRTVQTAKILNINSSQIIKDQRLTEIEQGIYTGLYFDKLTLEQKERKKLRLASDGVESYEQAFIRANDFICYLKSNFNNSNILIVTHNIIASCIEKICTADSHEKIDLHDLKLFDNAELKVFKI